MNYNHVRQIFGQSFLGDLLEVWSHTNHRKHEEVEFENIKAEIIWLNSNICSQEKPLINRKLAANGLMYVTDLIDEQGTRKNCNRLAEEFNDKNFLEIIKVTRAVPKRWLEILENNYVRERYEGEVTVLSGKKVYKNLIEKNYAHDFEDLSEFWNRKAGIENIDWKIVFKISSKISIISKIKDFAFRFLNRIIFSDFKLFLSKLRDTSLCSFCSKDVGDLIHNYWSCPLIQTFLASVMGWYNDKMNADLKLDRQIFLLGTHSTNRRLDIFTEFFYWSLKWFIHCCRHAVKIPSLYNFKTFLKLLHDDEKHYAIQKDLMDQHNRKWLIPARALDYR